MPAGSLTAAATNLSMFGLFLQADFVVKTVIIVLALASVWSWAIIFEKVMLLRSATEDAKNLNLNSGRAGLWTKCSISWNQNRSGWIRCRPFLSPPCANGAVLPALWDQAACTAPA